MDIKHTFKNDLLALIKKHEPELKPEIMLGIAAQMTGMLIALQDQNVATPERVMNMVYENIQRGNHAVAADLMSHTAGNA